MLCPPFNKSVIGLYPIIKILALPDSDLLKGSFIVGSYSFFVSTALIHVNHFRTAIVTDGFTQEFMRCIFISSLSK
jgi:hypothetical protein